MAYKRHNYRPLSAEERTEDRYPTYSFTVKDDKFAMDIAEQLFDTQVEDRTFTYQHKERLRVHKWAGMTSGASILKKSGDWYDVKLRRR